MKQFIKITVFFYGVSVLSSCGILFPPKKLIQNKDKYIWTSNANENMYYLVISENEGIWFDGTLVINGTDTLYLNGFEKGNNHPTEVFVKNTITDSLVSLGYIHIWTYGNKGDSLQIHKHQRYEIEIPNEMIMYKRLKDGHK